MARSTYGRGAPALAMAIVALLQAPATFAQGRRTAATADAAEPTEEIIVTGSRLGRTSFNSPTPVNVVGQDRLQDLAITNVGDALNQIPSFRPLTTPATNAFRAGTNIGGRSLDLRGLGTARTLTLVDGRRNVPSGDENTFDRDPLPNLRYTGNGLYFDSVGRTYKVGIRANW